MNQDNSSFSLNILASKLNSDASILTSSNLSKTGLGRHQESASTSQDNLAELDQDPVQIIGNLVTKIHTLEHENQYLKYQCKYSSYLSLENIGHKLINAYRRGNDEGFARQRCQYLHKGSTQNQPV